MRACLNAREAIETFARRAPALLLIDLQMPVMGGLELLIRLRAEHGADMPPVILSSGTPPARETRFPGVIAVLSKRALLEELPELLRAHLPPRPAREAAEIDELLRSYVADIERLEGRRARKRTS